ncbi:hypothetical protein IQ229_10455 [Nostoc cf. edaphicum LEGE 07299]|uniref:Ribbon-helix-helix protein CopG domain-containing protein n=1 Tax=Nostoc cf. edaphicum LEGE 07299 TaxID=2777974 RepID=A0ABR9TZT9_9NOSO|nr:CopG family transcriptional regulator [Nostoc edaphicum]MBE9105347.1 hypothetical protein [Nostoc cf. edaphicum LEGE 07299]
MANNITNMTLRLPDDLNLQLQAASKAADVSKHQMILDLIRSGLAGQVSQSLEVAQQVKEQLAGDRPITDVAIDTKNALDMIQAQLQMLQGQYQSLKEDIAKKKEEPEVQFKAGYEITKQSTLKYSMLLASDGYEQEWGRGNRKDKYIYHTDLGIITKVGRTKTGRKSFWVLATDVEDLQVSPDGDFISPLGGYGYDLETWEREAEEVKGNSGVLANPYKYWAADDEEMVSIDYELGITAEYLHETFDIDFKVLFSRTTLDIQIDGVWTHFIKQSDDIWAKTGYYRAIDYKAKVLGVK